jgi:hypothetical protein
MARGAVSDGVGNGGRELLAVGQFLGASGHLERILVQLRNYLTFKMPSPITLSIPDSADLKQNWACLPSMWRGRGDMLTSAWRLCTGVALYALETVLRQWFSTLWSSSASPFQRIGVKVGRHQAGQPVVMIGYTTAVKSSLDTLREAPLVEAVSLEKTVFWVASLDLMCCKWGCQLSFLSSKTTRTCTEGLGLMVEVGRVRGQALLCFVLALVKCTMIYFSGAQDAPCLLAHSKHHS